MKNEFKKNNKLGVELKYSGNAIKKRSLASEMELGDIVCFCLFNLPTVEKNEIVLCGKICECPKVLKKKDIYFRISDKKAQEKFDELEKMDSDDETVGFYVNSLKCPNFSDKERLVEC